MSGRREMDRRTFLQHAAAAGFGGLVAAATRSWSLDRIDNPLARYPDRGWERVYRDLFAVDDSFVFLCAPNDTHNCLLRAYVRNGVVTRIGPTMGYGEATDLLGNRTSHRWDPRCCQKGLALTRRFYGDRRVRYPMVRKGFKAWVDNGFPRGADGRPPAEYFRRGWDGWERVGWDAAADMTARTLQNIAATYAGPEGARRLAAQGYDKESVEAMAGAGTQCLKFRGGMPLLGVTRVMAMYRLAGSMALLDAKMRGVGPDQALGGRGWDNYSWHTDLPPGHTMVTGTQTVEFDLFSVERARIVLVWGMNWITTKMPDSHWLTEARLKGTKVVVIACEYSATAHKGDQVIVVRPGTTPALALGLCHVIFRDRLYDDAFVKRFTDLPLLVRLDTLKKLRASDLQGAPPLPPLGNFTRVMAKGEVPPPPGTHREQLIPAALREQWGDAVVWDRTRQAAVPLSRDAVGTHFDRAGLDPQLEGEVTVRLKDGRDVRCRPTFDLVRQYVIDNFPPEATEAMTWAPRAAVEGLAREVAASPAGTLMALGMGPNQFFNNDLKDRAVFLLAALTNNVGHIGGNVGSYAGNYRIALFNGLPQYMNENPFDIELDPAKPARVRQYWRAESAHYYNHEDHPLKVGNRMFTGKGHIPTPTKSLWFANANSILGNVKWHYNVVNNQLPKMEFIGVNEWWWSTSCEYADIVFAIDSWAELKQPDMTASVTNPFLQVFPRTPLPRIFETRGDAEAVALVASKLAALTGDRRFEDYFRFVREGRTDVHLQRILDNSSATKGYQIADLEAKATRGVPALMMTRTNPRAGGWEQTQESKPWWTKSGRLEFYRDEDEFIAYCENLPVYREPIDSTFYEPNVIVGAEHPCFRQEGPEEYGLEADDLSCEARQVRNVVKPWSEVARTEHPLRRDGYRFIFHTPKYRHGAHTTPIDTDMVAVLFGPFGDVYRRDPRAPFVTEGYVDINPLDARELGVDDGDYVWIDSDPSDRPYRGWKQGDPAYEVARLLCRARYYPGTPPGVTRMWFNMYGATPGSLRGSRMRVDRLAKNPDTNYQAMFRSGSHQSTTRGWLKPTLMTDSLPRKELLGQVMGQGFLPDSHCPTGAPRESIVKITRAEPGGLEGKGLWRPAALGLRPGYESDAVKRFLEGGFIRKKE
ncbi:MAG: molybdopterin oxidoreductase [Acidobacteria bacterium RIFCSPLOWO2_12_FULL_68_19]|nr:MAG: molybdopterin oxidoreductase [Acidobacteria bacterium RIFCSPLOWO2_12_FULL_68_19]